MLLDRVAMARGEDKVGKNNRYAKNLQNYTFGGKKSIKGNELESMVKKEIDINPHIEESFYTKEEI